MNNKLLLLYYFSDLTWNEILNLYKLAEKEVKIIYKINDLNELPFGKGYAKTSEYFLKKISLAQKTREERRGIINEK